MAGLNFDEFRNGRVICQECGQDFSIIAPAHLKRKHDMSYDDYRAKYPDAPVSSSAYRASRFTHRGSTLFADKEEESTKKPDDPTVCIPEKRTLNLEGVFKNKRDILQFLFKAYPCIENNYQVDQRNPITGKIEYLFITDIACPVKKVIWDFPQAFWHNNDPYPDPHKFKKLKSDGWIVISIGGHYPTVQDLTDQVDIISD